MQIDLANILVHKAYFVYYVLFIISPQAHAPLPWEGLGVGFTSLPLGGSGWVLGRLLLKRGGHTDKRVNHKVNFDFD